jgi:hypothetical protein
MIQAIAAIGSIVLNEWDKYQSGQADAATEAGLIRRKATETVATQRNIYAASGVDQTRGTPVDVQAASAGMGELDARMASNNAAREAWGYRMKASAARTKAEYSSHSGIIGLATKFSESILG